MNKAVKVGDRWIEVLGPYRRPDGRVCAMSARDQQAWADLEEARLPTAEEFDAIWREADVRVLPVPRDPALAAYTALDSDIGAAEGLVAAGKTWIDHPRGPVINYGWFVPNEEVSNSKWRGISVHKSVSGDFWVIQSPGAAHNNQHIDYSQLGYVVRDLDPGYEPAEPITKPATPEAMQPRTAIPPPPPLPHDTDPIMPKVEVSLPVIVYRAAKVQKARAKGPPIWIVIHTAELLESNKSAENLMMWAAASAPVSWHYAVDGDTITQSVRDDYQAAAAPGSNELGIHIELVGYARQSDAEWRDDFSTSQLDLAAKLVAHLCHRWQIPAARVTASGLIAGARGICGHADVTLAFQRSTHTDPGAHFPWERFLDAVSGYLELVRQES